jgi:Domain of unknown function (DUF4192)
MTTNSIKLTSPQELLAVVPYLLGFNPTNSIVTMCLRNNRLGLTQRLDLPRPQDALDVAQALLPTLVNEHPDSVILIGYEDCAGDSLPALEALTTALHSHSMPVHDRLVVRDGRWRSLDCHSPNCCPPEGSTVPEPADVPGVISEFVGQGVSPHPDRESLARQVEPGPQAATVSRVLRSRQRARSRAGDCLTVPRAELFEAWPRILDPDAPAITVEDAALAAVSLLDIEIRDAMVAWLCPGTLGLDELGEGVQKLFSGLQSALQGNDTDPAPTGALNGIQNRLIRLCAMLPDDLAAPALSILASFTWWRGDGALARVALARALRSDPDYRLALLLQQMVDLAIRPQAR